MAKHGWETCTESGSSPSRPASSPLGPTHRTPAHDPPALKSARAGSPDDADVPSTPMSPSPLGSAHRVPARSHPARSATHSASSPVGTSAGASIVIAEYSALPAPVVRPFPSDRRRPILPVSVSLPLPRFASQDITRISVAGGRVSGRW